MRCGATGWSELDTVEVDRAELLELWELVASGDRAANDLVADVLDVDPDEICDVDMVADPCELNDDWSCYRVWYKRCERGNP